MKKIGVYIHIPFCKSKCYYCDFISFANCGDSVKEYVSLLKSEVKDVNKYKVETIYIGGGTPSFIDSRYIEEILDEIKYKNNAEITIEVNPGTADEQKLTDYFNMGINRISIGLQSSDNNILKQIGRIHKYDDFEKVYNLARKIGYKNINVDLMIGLPGQTMNILQDTVYKVINIIRPEHISVYSLILEENTKLWNLVKDGKLEVINDELERRMYWYVKKMLEKAGYEHYEISNYAKPGFYSKHNMDCWSQKEYIGYGLSAHSYINNIRYCNTSILKDYMKSDKIINEIQTEYTKMQEYVMLGLRKIEGISKIEFERKFRKDIHSVFNKELSKLINNGLMNEDNEYIKLSTKGIDFANIVWEEFV